MPSFPSFSAPTESPPPSAILTHDFVPAITFLVDGQNESAEFLYVLCQAAGICDVSSRSWANQVGTRGRCELISSRKSAGRALRSQLRSQRSSYDGGDIEERGGKDIYLRQAMRG